MFILFLFVYLSVFLAELTLQHDAGAKRTYGDIVRDACALRVYKITYSQRNTHVLLYAWFPICICKLLSIYQWFMLNLNVDSSWLKGLFLVQNHGLFKNMVGHSFCAWRQIGFLITPRNLFTSWPINDILSACAKFVYRTTVQPYNLVLN